MHRSEHTHTETLIYISCLYIYTYTYMYTYIYMYTYRHIHICICIYIYTYRHIHICICVYIYTQIHVCIHHCRLRNVYECRLYQAVSFRGYQLNAMVWSHGWSVFFFSQLELYFCSSPSQPRECDWNHDGPCGPQKCDWSMEGLWHKQGDRSMVLTSASWALTLHPSYDYIYIYPLRTPTAPPSRQEPWFDQQEIEKLRETDASPVKIGNRSAGRSGIALLILAALCVAPAGDSEIKTLGQAWATRKLAVHVP